MNVDVGGENDMKGAESPCFVGHLTPGGLVVLDQYNFAASARKTVAARECLPNVKVRALNPSWMPTAYLVKPSLV